MIFAAPISNKPFHAPPAKPWVVVGRLFRFLFWVMVILTPLLGVWLASSLASYFNGPRFLAFLAGALLFPVLPITWEVLVARRRRKKGITETRYLSVMDRIILRTLAINAAFIAVLLMITPSSAFTALSARGDWILDGNHTETANTIRKNLFLAADRLEWLYLLTHDNPYTKLETKADKSVPTPAPRPKPENLRISDGTSTVAQTDKDLSETDSVKTGAPLPAYMEWPLKNQIHPAVAAMPESEKTSIPKIARYLSSKEDNPYMLVKAIHDYVAERVHYDFASLDAGRYPPYAADIVNQTRSGVCAGYAKLFEAIATAAGFNSIFIGGLVRQEDDNIDGNSHAWNAIEIDGMWQLVDTTWDSPHAKRDQRMARYSTDYLFTPPTVFALDHFPDNPEWQLLDAPLSRGDFIRQPMLTARFFSQNLSLVSPRRSQVTVDNQLTIQIDKPGKMFVMAAFSIKGEQRQTRCITKNDGRSATLTCDFPTSNTYQVTLFSNTSEFGTYASVGHIEAVRL